MGLGLGLLMHKSDGESVSAMGFVLVMASSLTYAIYLVMINVSKQIRKIPTLTLLFYTLLSGSALFGIMLLPGGLTMPPTAGSWINLIALALIPTVISLLLTTRAIQLIGSTPTAIFGGVGAGDSRGAEYRDTESGDHGQRDLWRRADHRGHDACCGQRSRWKSVLRVCARCFHPSDEKRDQSSTGARYLARAHPPNRSQT